MTSIEAACVFGWGTESHLLRQRWGNIVATNFALRFESSSCRIDFGFKWLHFDGDVALGPVNDAIVEKRCVVQDHIAANIERLRRGEELLNRIFG